MTVTEALSDVKEDETESDENVGVERAVGVESTVEVATSSPSSDDDEEVRLPVGDITCFKLVRSPVDLVTVGWEWIKVNKTQILSGITVSLAQVPEAVSFFIVTGIDTIVGLQSAWILGLTTLLIGVRPGMVACVTGAVAVILTSLVHTKGIGFMFYAIMLASSCR